MSFQGDVAGIGLGELLQGLARGGRDGVLTLDGDSLFAQLGLHKGQLYVLPAPDEDESLWRQRSQRAWADNPDPSLETSRRLAIARAGRLEVVYAMLASPNLHFRFETGPLPPPPPNQLSAQYSKDGAISLGEVAPQAPSSASPWGVGITVEYLLLEHARISDESSSGPAAQLTPNDLPRALDPASAGADRRNFLAQCDGYSTMQEIADRLEITLSQCRATVGELISQGRVRMAEPREQLAATVRELELDRFGRAAMRLTGWIESSPPGGPLLGDADLLIGEWHNGRLEPLLKHLQPRAARTLLRKLDLVHTDNAASQRRWAALVEAHHLDPIATLHEIALRLIVSDSPDTRTFHDLLRMARDFHEAGHDGRTRALLRLAASHLPSRPQVRVELGKHMLDSGLEEDGVRWLLDTARELTGSDRSERALVPIRVVLRRIPDHPEANELLIETRLLVAQRRRRRWSMMSAMALAVLVSLVAFVRVHGRREVASRIAQVQAHLDDPAVALSLLEDYFGKDGPEEVEELRDRLAELEEQVERRALEEWTGRFEVAEEECTVGDPVVGLRLALQLPPPPDVRNAPTVVRQDLFGTLARRMSRRAEELDLPPTATVEELHQEERFLMLLADMLALIDPDEPNAEESSFRFRIEQLVQTVKERSDRRAEQRAEMLVKQREREQDMLLANARSHDQAGDLERAIKNYETLVEMDPALLEVPEFRRELEEVRAHWSAVQRALELSAEGEHAAAEAALEGVCSRPVEHLMPWNVETLPSGAHVTLPDGSVRITPFQTSSAFGERVRLRFEYPGCEDRTYTTIKPADVLIHLHSFPDRIWAEGTDVEAAPVAVGDDHVVADRRGRIVRLDAQSRTRWEIRLQTLGGIARTPVFLPERPGTMLVLSEDGVAWLLDAATGRVEGPREIGSPPRRGPRMTRAGVTADFADGRVALWTNSLEPTFYRPEGMMQGEFSEIEEGGDDRNATLSLLNRGVNKDLSLVSPWTDWRVVVQAEQYIVTGPDGRTFSADRDGNWNFVAWESPKARLPDGRLWVSDGKGLRSYLPGRRR